MTLFVSVNSSMDCSVLAADSRLTKPNKGHIWRHFCKGIDVNRLHGMGQTGADHSDRILFAMSMASAAQLPDRTPTPGAIATSSTAAVCRSGYAHAARNVPYHKRHID